MVSLPVAMNEIDPEGTTVAWLPGGGAGLGGGEGGGRGGEGGGEGDG